MDVAVDGLEVGGEEVGHLSRAVYDVAVPGVAEAAVGEQGVELLEGASQGGVVGLARDDVVAENLQ